MPRRFLPTLVASFALVLVCAGSAAAISITFDGEVLRYREDPQRFPDDLVSFPETLVIGVGLEAAAEPPYLVVGVIPIPFDEPVRQRVHLGPGCHRAVSTSTTVTVRCPLGSVPTKQLRYRFTLGDSRVEFEGPHLRGVVYARRGSDDVGGGDRVYGGPGEDFLEGTRVYAGPGDDGISGYTAAADTPVLYGGRGNDELFAPGLLYGGPGNDRLDDTFFEKSADMLVGGPGRDTVSLARDRRSDVVRVRGGDVDRIRCPGHPDPNDALFVDRSDRVERDCNSARILFTERPRYPYP